MIVSADCKSLHYPIFNKESLCIIPSPARILPKRDDFMDFIRLMAMMRTTPDDYLA